jgi:hypothetical protein
LWRLIHHLACRFNNKKDLQQPGGPGLRFRPMALRRRLSPGLRFSISCYGYTIPQITAIQSDKNDALTLVKRCRNSYPNQPVTAIQSSKFTY